MEYIATNRINSDYKGFFYITTNVSLLLIVSHIKH